MGVHVAYTYNRKLYTGTITETGIHPDGHKPHVRHKPTWNEPYPASTAYGLEEALSCLIVTTYWKCLTHKSRWVYALKRQAEVMLGKKLTFNFNWKI